MMKLELSEMDIAGFVSPVLKCEDIKGEVRYFLLQEYRPDGVPVGVQPAKQELNEAPIG